MKKNYAIKILKLIYSYKNKRPTRIAVVDKCGTRKTNYHDFVDIVNSYAYYLKQNNIKAGDVVCVKLGKCMENYAFRLACACIGAIYITLRTDYPKNRINQIISECQPKIIITQDTIAKIKIDTYDCQIDESISDDEYFYIIYTSGTTGKPKGIVHDRSVFRLYSDISKSIYWRLIYAAKLFINVPINYATITDMTFIASWADCVFFVLGETTHLINEEMVMLPSELKSYFTNNKIIATMMVPSLLKLILPIPTLKLCTIIGESSSCDFKHTGVQVFNLYGCSECPCISFEHFIFGNVIGRTFKRSKVYLLNNDLKNICFEGPGIMCKYISDSELTKKTIGYNEKTGNRILYTQDKGRYVNKKRIQIIGRTDSTVKINGKRVDKAEVEFNLNKIDCIEEAVVVDFKEEEKKYLCAFYTSQSKKPIDKKLVIEKLRESIPDYMIPKMFVFMVHLPRNDHGKIDRGSLKEPKLKSDNKKYVAPSTETEKTICEAFEACLEVEKVGIHDDFFELGGNSLNAMETTVRLKAYNITMIDLQNERTPYNLSKLVKNNSSKKIPKYKKCKYYPLSSSANFQYNKILSCNKKYNEKLLQYNMVYACEIKGIDPQHIKQSVLNVLDNHLFLKAKLEMVDDNLMYVRRDDYYPEIDIVKLNEKPNKEFFEKLVKPFDLFDETLFRCKIFTYEKSCYVFFDIYHMLSDGTSQGIFMKDLLTTFMGFKPEPELINTFDLLKFIDEQSKEHQEDNYNYYKKLISNKEFTKIKPSAKKANCKPVYKAVSKIIKKSKISDMSKAYETTPSNLLLTLFLMSIAKTQNLDEVLMFYFFGNRNFDVYDKNNVGCLYNEFPLLYKHDENLSIKEVFKELNKQVITSSTKNYSTFDFPEHIEQHNIVFNFAADFIDNNLSECPFDINLINLDIPLYANIDFSLTVYDANEENYLLAVEYNDAIFTNQDAKIVYDELMSLLDKFDV